MSRAVDELRTIVEARHRAVIRNRDRAAAADRKTVAMCRQSDAETLEWVLEQIDALRAPSGEARGG